MAIMAVMVLTLMTQDKNSITMRVHVMFTSMEVLFLMRIRMTKNWVERW